MIAFLDIKLIRSRRISVPFFQIEIETVSGKVRIKIESGNLSEKPDSNREVQLVDLNQDKDDSIYAQRDENDSIVIKN